MNLKLENELLAEKRDLKIGVASYYGFYLIAWCITLVVGIVGLIGIMTFEFDREIIIGIIIGSLIIGVLNFCLFLTVLIMSIMKKQFKVFLSLLIILYAMAFIINGLSLLTSIGFQSTIYTILLNIIVDVIVIYLITIVMKNLNYWSYNKYIQDGYIVTSEVDEEAENFIKKAQTINKPKWVFFI